MKLLIYQNSTWKSCKPEKLANKNVIVEIPIEIRKIIWRCDTLQNKQSS